MYSQQTGGNHMYAGARTRLGLGLALLKKLNLPN
jgi:hypothetical protein